MHIFGHKIFYRELKILRQLRRVMLNTLWERKIKSVGIKSVIFTGRPPLELSCFTSNTKHDSMSILQIRVAKLHVLCICKRCKNL